MLSGFTFNMKELFTISVKCGQPAEDVRNLKNGCLETQKWETTSGWSPNMWAFDFHETSWNV